jgi:hypothetical protein
MAENFGAAVAVSADGRTIAIGAPLADGPARAQGAVLVFVRPAGDWQSTGTFAARLTVEDAGENDRMGTSVAISADGGTIIAGAPNADGQGAIFLWTRPAGGWSGNRLSTAKLLPELSQTGSLIGMSVAIDAAATTVIGGAPGNGDDTGAVFFWTRPEGGWVGDVPDGGRVWSKDRAGGDGLGGSVGLSADGATIVAGAPETQTPSGLTGAGYLWLRQEGGWGNNDSPNAKLVPSSVTPRLLGTGIAISGDGVTVVLAGMLNPQVGPGVAYVYQRPADGWGVRSINRYEPAAELRQPGLATSGAPGGSASASPDGSTILIGAPTANGAAGAAQGAALRYERPAGGWSGAIDPIQTIRSAQPGLGAFFGMSLGLDSAGKTAIVGAPGAGGGRGAASVLVEERVAGFEPTTARPGETVVIRGSNLAGATAVSFGGAPAASFTASASEIRAVVGRGASGAVSVTVPEGVFTQPGFTFQPGPSATRLTISSPVPPGPVTTLVGVTTALGPPSGMVTVRASTGESCSAPVSAGGCILQLATLGPRTVTASYEGDAFFTASASDPATVVVQPMSLPERTFLAMAALRS